MTDGMNPERHAHFDTDYVIETDITASGMWAPQSCHKEALIEALEDYIAAAQTLDRFKKVLFRGLPPNHEKVKLPLPRLGQSLDVGPDLADLVHGGIGLATESGELAEVLLKMIAHGEVPDKVNVREEIGDCLWYLSRLVKWATTTFFAEMVRNIRKLRGRHGSAGFNTQRDVDRNLETERKLLEE